MTFAQALRLLQQAEYKARAAQAKIDAANIQFDNAREVINQKYQAEWQGYCTKNNLHSRYTFNDVMAA